MLNKTKCGLIIEGHFVLNNIMFKMFLIVFVAILGICSAFPSNPVLQIFEQDVHQSNGDFPLEDVWISLSNLRNSGRYNPAYSNSYHLFTRLNPRISQPLTNSLQVLAASNYNNNRRTIVLIHGWMDSVLSDFNNALVPVLLAAEDLNVIVVDWSPGASSFDHRVVNFNCILSGAAVAEFITWLNGASGSNLDQYVIIGHGVGGHQAGIVGRNLEGLVPYIIGLNPALIGWVNNIFRFQPTDGKSTEVIHTNYVVHGYLAALGQLDFYPNGGVSMPGCDSNECDHAKAFQYFAESIISRGFTGRECANYYAAVLRICFGPKTLQMGGLTPKIGESGVYLLETNASPPFSKG